MRPCIEIKYTSGGVATKAFEKARQSINGKGRVPILMEWADRFQLVAADPLELRQITIIKWLIIAREVIFNRLLVHYCRSLTQPGFSLANKP
jgi:hypothetical protein